MDRTRWGVALILLVAFLGGCDPGAEVAPSASTPHATPSPRSTPGSGVSGGISTGDVTVQPAPTPTPVALLPRVQRIELSPLAATVSFTPYDAHGNPTGVPGSLRLQAVVVYGDGTRNDLVTWRSLDPGIAAVTAQGEVMPAPPIGQPVTGTGSVVAIAQLDPAVTATCTVTVVP